MKNLLIIIPIFCCNLALANVQEVYIQENQANQDNSDLVTLDVIHKTDNLSKLTTLGLNLIYNDTVLELVSINDVLTINLIARQEKKQSVAMGWANWYGYWQINQQQKLYTISFKFKTNTIAKSSSIQLNANNVSNGYEFISNEFIVYK